MFNPVFLKVGLGGAAITSVGTVGLVYRDKIKDFFSQSPSTTSTYVIAKTTTALDTSIDKELYETDGSKNFKCVLASDATKKDDDCSIFSIDAPQSDKLNNLDELEKSNTKAVKDKITTDTYFKLILNDSLLSSKAWDGTQTIDIVDKTTTTKKYGSFTLQYKVNGTKLEGKTNLVIGKIKEKKVNADLKDPTTFKCSIGEEKNKEDCSLFKIKTTVDETKIKEISLTGIEAAGKTAADYDANNYFVIDLKRTPKKNISDFTDQTIAVNVTLSDETTVVATFEVKASLAETKEAFSTTNLSKIIFV